MTPRSLPLLSWLSPDTKTKLWLNKIPGIKRSSKLWYVDADVLEVPPGINISTLRLHVRGSITRTDGGYKLTKYVPETAIFLPRQLVDDALLKFGDMQHFTSALLEGVARAIATPGDGSVNLAILPQTTEWRSVGVVHIHPDHLQRIEELPVNLHVVLAAAIMTVDAYSPLMSPKETKRWTAVYPSLPFPARRILNTAGDRNSLVNVHLEEFLKLPVQEQLSRCISVWLECHRATIDKRPEGEHTTTGGDTNECSSDG
jgi:hypothetical protein